MRRYSKVYQILKMQPPSDESDYIYKHLKGSSSLVLKLSTLIPEVHSHRVFVATEPAEQPFFWNETILIKK